MKVAFFVFRDFPYMLNLVNLVTCHFGFFCFFECHCFVSCSMSFCRKNLKENLRGPLVNINRIYDLAIFPKND